MNKIFKFFRILLYIILPIIGFSSVMLGYYIPSIKLDYTAIFALIVSIFTLVNQTKRYEDQQTTTIFFELFKRQIDLSKKISIEYQKKTYRGDAFFNFIMTSIGTEYDQNFDKPLNLHFCFTPDYQSNKYPQLQALNSKYKNKYLEFKENTKNKLEEFARAQQQDKNFNKTHFECLKKELKTLKDTNRKTKIETSLKKIDDFSFFSGDKINVKRILETSANQFYKNVANVDKLIISYTIIYKNPEYNLSTPLSSYFRSLYHLIKFIDSSQISTSKKTQFYSIIRTGLSSTEQEILFINSFSPMAQNGLNKKYIAEHNLIKNITKDSIFNVSVLKEFPNLKFEHLQH